MPPIETLPAIERKLMVKANRPPELAMPEMPTPLPPSEKGGEGRGGEAGGGGRAMHTRSGPSHTVELAMYKPQKTTKMGITLTSDASEAPTITAVHDDGVAQVSRWEEVVVEGM